MKNFFRPISKALLGLIMTLPLAVSCFDDSELWEAIDQLEMRVDSLENNLNSQMQIVSDMLSGKKNMVISDCVMNADSSYVVTLTNGTSFTVLPQNASVSSLVSVMTVNGKNCWAKYNEAGVLTPLLDSEGQAIPVDIAVSVKIVDGKYYLVVAGSEFETGYDTEDLVQVFNSCQMHKDASGNVYAMTFDFGGGISVTVTVDGYKGVLFKMSNASSNAVAEYFIDYAQTVTFLMETKDVVDYVMQIPDGWRVVEKEDKLTGEIHVSITAPSRETVALGAAVASGDLKVVSVVEGGKAAVTRLSLSTDPFKTFNVTPLKAIVEPFNGIQKFVYGIALMDDFEEELVVAEANKMLTDASYRPEDCFISEVGFDKTHEEILPGLQEGGAYIFWAVPAVYNEGDGEEMASFTASVEKLRTYLLVPIFAKMKVSDVTLLDANLEVKVIGVDKMYAGLTVKGDNTLEEIVYMINNGAEEIVNDKALLSYEGPASGFPDAGSPAYIEHNSTYVAWLVPFEEGKTEYSVSDVVYQEFTTLPITDGGSLAVTIGEATTEPSSISFPVSCDDAAMVYYAYVNSDDGEFYSASGISNSTRWDLITGAETFGSVRGSSATAVIEGMVPNTTRWLFAVAIGHDGKYGEVKFKSATSEDIELNSLKVSVATTEILTDAASFKVTVTGGTASDYIYWVGRTANDFWVTTCGKSVVAASKYLAANPDVEIVTSLMKENGKIAADGTFSVSGLTSDKEHIALVLAKDEEGRYSMAGELKFETFSIDLGADFVAEGTDKWNETKKWIEDNIKWHEETFRNGDQLPGYYSFDIKIPQDLNASISTSYPLYYDPESAGMDDTIIAFEEYCAASRSTTLINGYELPEDEQKKFDLVDADGKMHNAVNFMYISEYFVHGAPKYGRFTYFSSTGHNSASCPLWKDLCQNYHDAEMAISQKMDVEYWKSWVMDVWYSDTYGRVFNDEQAIAEFAKGAAEVYTKYYKDKKPVLYVNDGSAVTVINGSASGVDENGNVLDRVFIILKDNNGNYYAPMTIEVPNYF